jgi:hypothetical protein
LSDSARGTRLYKLDIPVDAEFPELVFTERMDVAETSSSNQKHLSAVVKVTLRSSDIP